MKKSNKSTLWWIFDCSKHYIPVILIIALLAAVISFEAVALAMVSKSVLEIATGDKTGSFLLYGIIKK